MVFYRSVWVARDVEPLDVQRSERPGCPAEGGTSEELCRAQPRHGGVRQAFQWDAFLARTHTTLLVISAGLHLGLDEGSWLWHSYIRPLGQTERNRGEARGS